MKPQSGNVLFIILIAIALIGALSMAIMGGDDNNSSDIDDETLLIRVSEVRRTITQIQNAVDIVMNHGYSQDDVRFSHASAAADYDSLSGDTDKTDQVFHRDGGAAAYPAVPADINDGSKYEFYGHTDAPNVGSDKADLILVLPNVTQQFCTAFNKANNLTTIPDDTGSTANSCVFANSTAARFSDSQQYYTTVNTMDDSTFPQNPATSSAYPANQACVKCQLDGNYHVYHVLIQR